jgi:hypothetical protein
MITELDDFKREILRKIDNKENLTKDEIGKLLYDDYSIDSVIIFSDIWFNYKKDIIQLGKRTFRIIWKQRLTEMHESLFASQLPVEVKLVTKTEWVELE